jgi:hypothetical protein
LATNIIDNPKGSETFGKKFCSKRKIFLKRLSMKGDTSSIGAVCFLSAPVILSINLFNTAGGK